MFLKREKSKIKELTNKKYDLFNNDNLNIKTPICLSKKLLNNYKSGIHMSGESTLNTISNSPTKNNYNEQNTNISEKDLNGNNSEIISRKLNIVFKALEQLIINDNNENNNNKNNKNENNNNENNNIKINSSEKDLNYKKPSKKIGIPKLDFSYIFDYYHNNPIIIKEIKINKIWINSDNKKNIKYIKKYKNQYMCRSCSIK